jgi:hypothetical protein
MDHLQNNPYYELSEQYKSKKKQEKSSKENLPKWVAPYSKYSRHIYSTGFKKHLCKHGFQIVAILHLTRYVTCKWRHHILWHPELFIIGYLREWYSEHESKDEGIEWHTEECVLNFELKYDNEAARISHAFLGYGTKRDNGTISQVCYHWQPECTSNPYKFDHILQDIRTAKATFVEPEIPILAQNVMSYEVYEDHPDWVDQLPAEIRKYLYNEKDQTSLRLRNAGLKLGEDVPSGWIFSWYGEPRSGCVSLILSNGEVIARAKNGKVTEEIFNEHIDLSKGTVNANGRFRDHKAAFNEDVFRYIDDCQYYRGIAELKLEKTYRDLKIRAVELGIEFGMQSIDLGTNPFAGLQYLGEAMKKK